MYKRHSAASPQPDWLIPNAFGRERGERNLAAEQDSNASLYKGGRCMRPVVIAVTLLALAAGTSAQKIDQEQKLKPGNTTADSSLKQKDVFNYDAQRAAPAGTRRI